MESEVIAFKFQDILTKAFSLFSLFFSPQIASIRASLSQISRMLPEGRCTCFSDNIVHSSSDCLNYS